MPRSKPAVTSSRCHPPRNWPRSWPRAGTACSTIAAPGKPLTPMPPPIGWRPRTRPTSPGCNKARGGSDPQGPSLARVIHANRRWFTETIRWRTSNGSTPLIARTCSDLNRPCRAFHRYRCRLGRIRACRPRPAGRRGREKDFDKRNVSNRQWVLEEGVGP